MAEKELEQQDTIGEEIEVGSSPNLPAQAKKVELDLDDAPFLQTEEKTPVPASVPDDIADTEDDKEKASKRKRKILIFGGAGGVLLLALGIAAWWFFFNGPPPPPPAMVSKPEVVVVPTVPGDSAHTEIVREFAPFIIPFTDPNGQTGFLVCKFSAISSDEAVNQEVQQQLLPLRDAIYYYLRGKDNSFLLDARNGEKIRQDLLSVFNDYLSRGKLEDIVFESYLSH